MKKTVNTLRHMALAMTAALMAAACADETPMPDGGAGEGQPEEQGVYMTVNIEMPNSKYSRSTTNPDGSGDISSDGTEVGTDAENAVQRVLIVLTDRNNNYITYGYVNRADEIAGNGADRTVTASFNKSALLNYYEKHATGNAEERRMTNIYAVINFPNWGRPGEGKNLIELLDEEVAGQPAKVIDRHYALDTKVSDGVEHAWVWSDNNFLMTNSAMATAHLPSLDDLNTGRYNTRGDAYNLTPDPITVERSVARIDYKAGGKPETSGGKTRYFYDLQRISDDENSPVGFRGEITRLGMVNLSKNFHYFRRVAPGRADAATIADLSAISLLGREHSTNYVIDTDAERKSGTMAGLEQNFFYPLVKEYQADGVGLLDPTTWYKQDIDEVLAGHADNWGNREYHRWRYVSENTIPEVSHQKNGISTGLIFKIGLSATEALRDVMPGAYAALTRTWTVSDMNQAPVIYAYGNKIYGTREDISRYFGSFTTPEQQAELREMPVFQAFMACTANPSATDRDNLLTFDTDGSSKAVSLGFTRLRCLNHTDAPGYYMYYYYWNRHNDNGNPNQMGPMEFATVRNNVYKICVTSVDGLGHPLPNPDGTQPDDPDPINPNHPDEKADVYLSVSVKILPWVVRQNDVTFP